MTSSSVLILQEEHVEQLITALEAIGALKEMLAAEAAGQIANLPRRRASVSGFTLHGMAAADSRLARAAWKQYTTTRHGARFHLGLYDTTSGELLALMQANRLGQLRTGAVTAIAAQRLAPSSGTGRLAMLGCGWQAESQLECLMQLAPPNSIRVFCRDESKRRSFANAMSQRLGAEIVAASSAESCVRGAQSLLTITSARQPVVEDDWLEDCRLVLAVGSNQPRHAEVPARLVHRAARIVVDDIESCRNEAGDLILAAAELTRADALWERVESLASALAADAAPRLSPWQAPAQADNARPVLFKSVGMAASDLALASLIYDRACEKNLGARIEL